ncbi:putative tRNA adenosine deaminase-associated protein [Aeromicrobium panaciterrae]|uniref:tRNA adenosine deaminase-associated protein n=1 Tax=Aeromicrobium panaciterrae TaxID=363861 RepID=A0ABU1UJQ1_9ACTN|nr:tRNA adenosine deaminase-associated protein [Aeromicrobium panaciterrae]MDR7085413.1 putative tRNA adenosine deaminase-associated protein [Aeromicrobium panaciterrae]
MAEDDVDFAVAAYRDEGEWQVVELHATIGEDVDELSEALTRFPSEVGVLGLVSMDDDFFVILRRSGEQVRALLSDVTAVTDWPLAVGVADLLDLPDPEDPNDPQPVGDLDILSDLGMPGLELSVLCDDDDLFPEDILRDVADRLGFGDKLDAIIG